jgi:hypothetical protein
MIQLFTKLLLATGLLHLPSLPALPAASPLVFPVDVDERFDDFEAKLLLLNDQQRGIVAQLDVINRRLGGSEPMPTIQVQEVMPHATT